MYCYWSKDKKSQDVTFCISTKVKLKRKTNKVYT